MIYDFWVFVRTLDSWHWAAFGLLLLALEMLSPSGFVLLWFGMSAIVVGLVMTFMHIGWDVQFALWGGLSILIASIWYFSRVRGGALEPEDKVSLNRRAELYVGQSFILDAPTQAGRGALRIGDSIWRAETHEGDLPSGTRVTVVSVAGNLLYIKAYKE